MLAFDDRPLLLLSDTAWVFNANTIFKPISGWSQLAFMEYGKGRVVMSGISREGLMRHLSVSLAQAHSAMTPSPRNAPGVTNR